MKESIIEEFNYKLESDALLDIFSTAGKEELNKDNVEVLTNKNLSVLILASGKGRSNIGEILSEMASSQALEILDAYQFDKKSPTEIVDFLKKMFFNINNSIIEYLEVAKIKDGVTSLSVAIIHNNTLYTAHIGETKIYLIKKRKKATLLSTNESYLGDKELRKENFRVQEEEKLHQKDTLFLCSGNLLEAVSEENMTQNIETIQELLAQTPPYKTTSFLRYLHYERSVEILRIETEDIQEYQSKKHEDKKAKRDEIDWERFLPIIRKIALTLGILIIFIFLYLLFANPSKTERLEPVEKNQTKVVEVPVEENNIVSIEPPVLNNKIKIEIHKEKNVKHEESLKPATLKLLNKADSNVLSLGDEGIRITFKEKQLIASQKEFFYEKNKNSKLLYCTLKAESSELQGEIVQKLNKQHFSNSVMIKAREDEIHIKIKIKNSCSYIRSNWAKKSGLDLLTFTCEK